VPSALCCRASDRASVRSAAALAIIVLVCSVVACSKQLSATEAERVITAYPKVSDVGGAKVEAISQADGSNEAIVRVDLGDTKLNAKLRRYDKGWQWEFVETTGGTWLSPDRAIAEIYEQQRMKRATAWANERASKYEATILAMDRYSENMPRRTDWDFTVAEWDRLRKHSAQIYRTISPSPERTKIAESLERPATDAWGKEVLLHFDDQTRTAAFVSTGPDAEKSTPDDVICLVVGGKHWDDFYDKVMWDYVKYWTVPEGLQPAVDKAVEDRKNRKSNFSKVVQ
jgi:hypothetical protein